MKKLFLLLGLVVATGSVLAITPPKNSKQTPRIPTVKQLTTQPNNDVLFSNIQKTVETPSAVTYTPMGWGEFSSNFAVGANTSPFAYDPASKSYYAVGMYRIFTNNVFQGARTYLYRLQNGRVLWDSITMMNQPNIVGGFYPSVGVINPSNSTDAKDVSVLFYNTAIRPGGANWTFQGGKFMMGTIEASAPYTKDLIIDEEFQNVDNTFGTTQNWQIAKVNGTANGAQNQALYTFGTLSPATGQQFGYYGFFGINEDGSEYQNRIPQQWNITNFTPSTSLDRSFQSGLEIDTDPLGNVYAACFNLPVASGQTFSARVPMVSKSTNFGATWSDFIICPEDKMKEFAVLNGFVELATSRVSPYQKNSFVVYGNDKYSFFFRGELLSEPTAGQFQVEKTAIFEAKYDEGNWTISQVAELRQTGLAVFERDLDNQQAVVFTIETHDLGNEVQVSKTKDGQNLIVKWIDENPNRIEILNPPVANFFQRIEENPAGGDPLKIFQTVDTVDVTDVYACYRNVNSNNWSTPVNITDDNVWNHSTWLPPVSESLGDLMLFSPRILQNFNTQFPALQRESVKNRITLGVDYRTTVAKFSLDGTSAGNEKPMEVTINNVYPSIASNQASIEFVSPVEVTTSIEITNINGEVVKTIFNGVSNVGQNLVGFTVNDMPNGVYFVTVKTGGNVQTSKFTVLK